MAVSIATLVLEMKRAEQVATEGHIEFVSLTTITNVHTARVANVTAPLFPAKIGHRPPFKVRQCCFQLCRRQLARASQKHRARIILDDVAHENTERRERARKRGYDHAGN